MDRAGLSARCEPELHHFVKKDRGWAAQVPGIEPGLEEENGSHDPARTEAAPGRGRLLSG